MEKDLSSIVPTIRKIINLINIDDFNDYPSLVITIQKMKKSFSDHYCNYFNFFNNIEEAKEFYYYIANSSYIRQSLSLYDITCMETYLADFRKIFKL